MLVACSKPGFDAMFRRLLLLCAFLTYGSVAEAQYIAQKQLESSLRVTGTIDITPAGDVVAHTVDQPEKLPEGIVGVVARMASEWKFEPVALRGHAVSHSKMSLLFVAKKLDNGELSVELRSTGFASASEEDRPSLDETNFKRPIYPLSLAKDRVSGTVYLVLKVGRDGQVLNADVSRVNLGIISSQPQLQRWRNTLKRSALAFASSWRFHVPAAGPSAGKDYWLGTMPIIYGFSAEDVPYGQWETYVAGPHALIPWLDDKHMAEQDPGALAPNTFHAAGEGRRLRTPLAGG